MKQVQIGQKTYPIEVTKKRIRNLYLRVNEEGVLQVSIPRYTTNAQLHAFLVKNQDWIEKRMQHLKTHVSIESIDDYVVIFNKKYPVKRLRVLNGKSCAYIEDNMFYFVLKEGSKKQEEDLFQEFAKKTLKEEVEARRIPWDKRYAKKPNVKFVFRKMSSRWGVCHIDKNYITMNTRLIHYPIEAFEYVLLHEYVHFQIPNHSKAFYQEIESQMSDYKKRKSYLK